MFLLPYIGKRFRRTAIAATAALALGTGLFASLGPVPGGASSHREAPLVSADPQVDGTDLYAFVSPDAPDTVTMISDWLPFEEPAGGPNFYAWAQGVNYDINIDNDGDARADVIYRWRFTNHYRNTDTFLYNTGVVESLDDPDLNFFQTYDLWRITDRPTATLLTDDAISVPSNVGEASMPDFRALVQEGVYPAGCDTCKTWAGQADDPFFLDLRVFDLLYGLDFSEVGDDTLAGFNMHAVALQVPKEELTAGGDGSGIVGVWTTAQRRSVRIQRSDGSQQFKGRFVQVSRLGMPLVNEVVVPVGTKDFFNASHPTGDEVFLPKVLDPELPHLIFAIYGIEIPDCTEGPPINRDCDLVPVFLTGLEGLNKPPVVEPSEMLRLNTNIPPCEPETCEDYSRLGVIDGDLAGFPDGRRLADDIIDISLRVVEGILIPDHDPRADDLSDFVDANDLSFEASFPYLGIAHSGSDPAPHSPLRRI
ncbi:MAG: DUF4331 domain-containing protein [Actinomycetota bacterium]